MGMYYAIEFEKSVINKLSQYQTYLKQNSESGDFSDKESFHITVLFVGDDVKSRKPYIEALDKLKEQFKPQHFEVQLQNFNFFDNGNGKIAWVGVKNSLPLYEVKKNLEATLTSMGFEPPKSQHDGYTPHITMGYNVITKDSLNTKFEDDTPVTIKSVCLWDSFKANDTYITNKLYEVFF